MFNAAIVCLAQRVSELGTGMRTLIAGQLNSSSRGNRYYLAVMPDDATSLGICSRPISDHSYPTAGDLAAYVNNFGVTLEAAKLVKEGMCVAPITNEAAARMGF